MPRETTEPERGIPDGTMLGKFEVLRKIATGGMAEIYLARVTGRAGFEKLVVIKRILPTAASDPRLIQMFLDEARLVATFQHPNIADVHEVGEDRGAPFFAMEHIHGQDARSIRITAHERHERVPLAVALAIVHATAAALDYAHDRRGPEGRNLNLVHRDVSTSNVLVSYEGAIKLIDFGVARVTTQKDATEAGTVKGNCPYMSPEQCRGLPLDRRSDLFSLGVVMYEMTLGRRPFQGDGDYEIMSQIVDVDPPRPRMLSSEYPPELERIVMKLLERDMEKRFQTAEQVLHDLDVFLEHHHLWISPKKISRYMRTLFADRSSAWEQGAHHDLVTFAEHIALAMNPEGRRGRETPPTPLPAVMRLSLEIAAAMESEAAPEALPPIDMSVAYVPTGDTITIRTGESEPVGGRRPRRGDSTTAPTTSPELHSDSVAVHGGDSITVPGGDTTTVPGGDTTTVPGGDTTVPGAEAPGGDSITLRPGKGESVVFASSDGPADARRPVARTKPLPQLTEESIAINNLVEIEEALGVPSIVEPFESLGELDPAERVPTATTTEHRPAAPRPVREMRAVVEPRAETKRGVGVPEREAEVVEAPPENVIPTALTAAAAAARASRSAPPRRRTWWVIVAVAISIGAAVVLSLRYV